MLPCHFYACGSDERDKSVNFVHCFGVSIVDFSLSFILFKISVSHLSITFYPLSQLKSQALKNHLTTWGLYEST